ncbi:MAG: gamma-glutamylcyclotransferase family protein [Candidatus Rickettsiella isopodorum]
MIRALIWKVWYEAYILYSHLLESEKNTWYFAYGANIDEKALEARSIKPKITQIFEMVDFELRFDHPSSNQQVGFASIHPAYGKKVWGKLYLITESEARKLDFEELVPVFHRYKREYYTQNNRKFYFYKSLICKKGLKPSSSYVSKIIHGLEAYNIVPHTYIDQLKLIGIIKGNRPAFDSRYFIKKLSAWPALLRGFAIIYERKSVIFLKFFESFNFFSFRKKNDN